MFHGPTIVTSGLTMMLDAANTKSYPGSGTAWSDLSRNGNNATLLNSPTYSTANSGYLVFDGTTQYATVTSNLSISAFSIICWIYSAGNQQNFTGICLNRNGANLYGIGCSYGGATNQLGYSWATDGATYNWASGLIIANGQWNMVAISSTTTSATLYLNLVSATQSHTESSFTLTGFQIANDSAAGGRLFNGNISTAQFYNRALGSSEVQQNFNAYRGRYGI